MRGAEPDRCVTNARRDPLGGELAAVNPDDGDRVAKPMFEFPQLRENVDAVDSAVSPEVQQEELAPEVGESESAPAGVQPVERIGEFGGAHRWGGDPVGHDVMW
jgi:hypothetical protein